MAAKVKFGVGWTPEAKVGLDRSPASNVAPAAPGDPLLVEAIHMCIAVTGAVQDSTAPYVHSMMHQKNTLKGAASVYSRYDNSMKGTGAQHARGGADVS